MNKLNSIDALAAKKAEVLARLDASAEKPTEVRVAMATCAIATGAKEAYDAIAKMVENQGLKNVVLKGTGCLGYCYAEPTVEVLRPGEEPVVYAHVDAKLAMDIIENHVKNGQVMDEHTVATCHVNA